MIKRDPKEQARREHNKRVRAGYREYKDNVKVGKGIARELRGYNAEVPVQIIEILEDIIETQNKGVPLSTFQKKTLLSLEESFKHINFDELTKPRFVFLEDGSVKIKDLHVITPEGYSNYTSAKIEGVTEGQTLETVLPLGDHTFEIIDLISETLAENAKLLEQLNKDRKREHELNQFKYSRKERENKDEFENRIMDLDEQAHKTKNVEVSRLLKDVFAWYSDTKDSILTPVGGYQWLADVPIVNNGDGENKSRKAETVDESTERHELYKLTNGLPYDIKLAKMLPKEITEKLINILAKALEENSRLHNELYKREKLQRKFPTKLIALILGAALVAGAIYALTKIDFKDRTVTPNEEVKQEEIIDENIKFNPGLIEYYINGAEENLDRIKAYNMALGDEADAIYSDAVKGNTEYYQDYLGQGYKAMSYTEMMAKFEKVLEELNTDKARAFVQMLIDKEATVPDDAPSKTLADYGLTQEEYDNYEKMLDYVYDLSDKLGVLEEDIVEHPNFQRIIDGSPVQITEKQIADKLASMGLGALVGVSGSLAAAFALMVRQAKKKEKELQQNNEAKADTTTGTNPV